MSPSISTTMKEKTRTTIPMGNDCVREAVVL